MKVMPRVKIFFWRACADALPTKTNLCRRGCNVDPVCVLCGETEESLDHLILKCSKVLPIWYASVLRLDMNVEQGTNFREVVWHKFSIAPAHGNLCLYSMEIWRGRNKMCFENKNFNMHEIINRSHVIWRNYSESVEKDETVTAQETHDTRWQRPRRGETKMNSDVAVLGDGKIGMGFVVRDEHGLVILAGKNEVQAEGSSVILEGLALRYAMGMIAQYRIKVDVVESDNKLLVEAINGRGHPAVYCDIIVADIKQMAKDAKCEKFEFIKRDGNQVAHQAARGPNFICIRHSPSHLLAFLESDLLV